MEKDIDRVVNTYESRTFRDRELLHLANWDHSNKGACECLTSTGAGDTEALNLLKVFRAKTLLLWVQ